jgi:predicted CxxxxCH...CXXCH cytochrome family protein
MRVTSRVVAIACLSSAAALLAACGGGALGNSPTVVNGQGTTGQKLSFVYFQKCVNPVLVTPLVLPSGGSGTCSSSGCHDNTNGTGGAFRTEASAAFVDLGNAANTPDVVRATPMYRNFFSAQGSTVVGAPSESRLLNKPLVNGVLHGGGLIFASSDAPEVRLMRYWISRPMPVGQDEFSSAAAAMFTPPDASTGTCNTQ